MSYGIDKDALAILLREAADALDRGQAAYTANVSIDNIAPGDATTVCIDVEILADADILDAAGRYFKAYGAVV